MLKIEIIVPDTDAAGERVDPAAYVAQALAAIGYGPRVGALPSPYSAVNSVAMALASGVGGMTRHEVAREVSFGLLGEPTVEQVQPIVETNTGAQQANGPESPAAASTSRRGRPRKAAAEAKQTDAATEQQQAISTGEERIDPAQADSAETAAADEADEQAEVEASRDPDKPLTLDDVRGAMAAYVQAFGMPATQEDGPKLFKMAVGEPPAGEAGWKVSLLETQEQMAAAVKYWTAAVAENPFKRDPA